MYEIYEEESEKMEEYLTRLGYSKETIKSYIKNLKYFFNWVCSADIYYTKDTNNINNKERTVKVINQELLNRYIEELHKKAITSKTIQTKYNVIRHYDKYLQKTKNQKVITKPFELQDIDLPKTTAILTIKEVKKLYEATEETIIGLRDRALLSLYYGCGLRNKEGTNISIEDIDYKREIIEIKPSKNYQNRFIPLSNKVKEDLYRYQTQSRPYIETKKTNILLLNNQGRQVTSETTRRIFNKLVDKAQINKPITLHMLRHSLGTHLLSQGMQLEQISQLLGHKSLDTTQIYAQIIKS